MIVARELAIENGKLKSNLDANGNKVANLATPTLDGDAATKKYVDERPFPPPSWSDITDKPDTFPPSAHTHTKSEITDFPTLSGQTFDISVDAQFKNMCIATARALGAVVTHTTDDTSTGGQVAQAYGITPNDATTFGELQTKAGLGDSAVIGDL